MRLQKSERFPLDVHEKSWGREYWAENCPEYCGKVLEFDRAHSGTSMHYHVDKLETMLVAQGHLQVDLIDTDDGSEYHVDLLEGDRMQIPRAQPHRLTAREDDTVVVEFSTFHADSDSYRVGPRMGSSCSALMSTR